MVHSHVSHNIAIDKNLHILICTCYIICGKENKFQKNDLLYGEKTYTHTYIHIYAEKKCLLYSNLTDLLFDLSSELISFNLIL